MAATKVPPASNQFSGTPRRGVYSDSDSANAIASKLVDGLYSTQHRRRDTEAITPPNSMIAHLANKIAMDTVDAENMIQLLPDMELAKQVLVSSILSPVDMISTELTYSNKADALADVKTAMMEVVKDYFENDFQMTSQLSKILEEILFTKGAYAWVILPESSIDHAINSNSRISNESFKDVFDSTTRLPKSKGLLGNADAHGSPASTTPVMGFGIESFIDSNRHYDGFLSIRNLTKETQSLRTSMFVTDNVDVLKLPKVHAKLVADRLQRAYGGSGHQYNVSVEAQLNTTAKVMDRVAQHRISKENTPEFKIKQRQFDFKQVIRIKTLDELDKETVGNPLLLTPPIESLIPVHVPSSPSEHIGYFLIVDNHGNPIRATATQDYYADFAYNAANMREMSSQLLANGRRSSEGRRDMNDIMMFEEAAKCYAEIIEDDLYQRLKSGIYGGNVKISRPTEIYRMMLARACSQMHTQLIYIPASLVVYAAFDHNDFGVGKSLVESTKILGAIRAILLFSNTMAAIKNSINHTKLSVKFDPDDPDPDYTVEQVMHDYVKSRFATFPMGVANPNDIVTYINNAGTSLETEGHPNYPDTKVEVSNYNAGYSQVSTELDDSLKKRHMMAYNVAPETVELSQGVDFATSIVNSNILLAKRSMRYQEKFTPFLEDLIRKVIYNSGEMMSKLEAIVQANRNKLGLNQSKMTNDRVVVYFVNNIHVSLPAPDLKRLETQMIAFENYSKSLDTALPAFLSSEMFDASVVGDLSNSIAVTTAVLKAQYQRRWLEENGVMSELFELVSTPDNKEGAFNLLKQHQLYLEGIGASTLDFMKLAGKFIYKSNKAIQAVQQAYNMDSSSSGGSDGGGENDSGGGDNGDFTGGDGDGDEDTTDVGGDGGDAGDDGGDNGDFDAPNTDDDAGGEEDDSKEDKGNETKKEEGKDDGDNGDFQAPA